MEKKIGRAIFALPRWAALTARNAELLEYLRRVEHVRYIDALSHDRDQLFAEAVHLYRGGSQWWPDQDFERTHIRPQQDDRFEADAWQQVVANYVATLSRVRVTDVAREAIGLEMSRIGTAEQRRVASILTTLGWKSGRDYQGRFYSRSA